MKQKTAVKLAIAGMFLCTLLWGSSFAVVKASLEIIPPIYLIAFRCTITTLGLCLIFFKKLKQIDKKILVRGTILGLFFFVAFAFQTIGCIYTTAGKNAFLTTSYVVLVPLIGWAITRRRPGNYVFIAAIIAFIGIGLLSLQDDYTVNIGDVLTLICGIGFAIHMFYVGRFARVGDAILLTTVQFAVVAVCAWIFVPIYDGAIPVEVVTTMKPILSILYLAIFTTMITGVLQNVCQKYVASNTTALILSLESVFGALAAAVLIGEMMTPRMIFGATLMLISIVLAETKFAFLTKRVKHLFR